MNCLAADDAVDRVFVAWMLSRGQRNMNVRGAFLHVLGDVLGSVAAIAARLVVWATGWTPIDPLLSLLIGGLALSAHVRVKDLAGWPGVLEGLRQEATDHGIGHATFQPEAVTWVPLVRI